MGALYLLEGNTPECATLLVMPPVDVESYHLWTRAADPPDI